MTTRKTCDKCARFVPDDLYSDVGECPLMGDSNALSYNRDTKKLGVDETRAYGWDYEGYCAGVYVGLKFGCIHWIKQA